MSHEPNILDIGGVQASKQPTAKFRFFIHDPEGHFFLYFRNAADRDEALPTIIDNYRADDGWNDEVKNIMAGEVSSVCQQTDFQARPEQINENGRDENGTYWQEGWKYICDYEMVDVQQVQQVEAEGIDSEGGGCD